jgi:threonine/homoserine/homoserine lactone efflux protein
MNLWLEGMIVGFSIAAPVGAIGFLCIQQTLQGGIRLGIATGLGAAVADTLYGIIVALGLGVMQAVLLAYKMPLSIIGGLFLCYLGIKKFFSAPPKEIRHPVTADLLKAFVSTFFLTLTNPATILDFIAIFTGLTLDTSGPLDSMKFVAGVFIGSAAWWLFLSTSVGIFRHKISHQLLRYINYVAGAVIFGFGVWCLYKVM